jgi:hypothetical protein
MILACFCFTQKPDHPLSKFFHLIMWVMSYIWKSLIIIIKKFSKVFNPAYNWIIQIKNIIHSFDILAKLIDLNLIFRWSYIKLIIPNSRTNLWSIKKVDSIFINCLNPPHDIYRNCLSLFTLIKLKKSFMKRLLNIMSISKILFHFRESPNLWCSETWIYRQTNSH